MPKRNSQISPYDYDSIYPNKKVLSSSQVLLYEKDPARFYTEYVLGVRPKPSQAMQIGLIFSELHRDRNFDFRAALKEAKAPARIADLFAKVIDRFPLVSAEVPMLGKVGNWKLRVTLDGYDQESFTIIENKTGQTEWNQERASFNDQITMQALVHWLKWGVTPRQILLNWVDTRSKSTQQLVTLKTKRTVRGLKMFQRRVELVIEGIEAENWTKSIYG